MQQLSEKGEVQCIGCNATISEREQKQIITPEIFNKLSDKFMAAMLKSMGIVECKGCKFQFTLVPGKIDHSAKDDKVVSFFYYF